MQFYTTSTEKSTCESKCFFQRCLPLRASEVAFGSDVYCVSEVSPYGEVGKHHITATAGSNIIMRSITSLWRSQNITDLIPHPRPLPLVATPCGLRHSPSRPRGGWVRARSRRFATSRLCRGWARVRSRRFATFRPRGGWVRAHSRRFATLRLCGGWVKVLLALLRYLASLRGTFL